jgi:NAD(P)-dependent dehydrogenase (short-subunit alcohol dehydrogenase family)
MKLKDQIAVVTGGSQGIGEALARRYAVEGAHVVIASRTLEKSQAVVDSIKAAGGKASAYRCDVSESSDCAALIEQVGRDLGGLDVLVNNAGAYWMSPLGDTGEDAIDQMLATNIKAPFLLAQAALPLFEKKGCGKIINTGSIFGNTGFPGSAIYCATKGAIHLMTKTLALELRSKNIQVNAIAPGWIETPLNEEYRATNEEFMRRARERFGDPDPWMKPDDLAGTAVFLASSDADSVTGMTMFVDRGWSAY